MTEMAENSQMSESHDGGVFQPRDILNDQKENAFDRSDVQIQHRRRGIGLSQKTRTKYFSRKENSWITTLLVGLIIMASLPPGISPQQLSEAVCKYFNYKEKCAHDMEESKRLANISEETHCFGDFDGFICWPHAKAGSMVEVPCPDYLSVVNDTHRAYRFCSYNASWYKEPGREEWKFIDECRERDDNVTEVDRPAESLLEDLRIMYTICDAISLACLVIALLLLCFFKKLHCTRNYIHMNLMVSFILKYVIILVKDRVIDTYYELGGATGGGAVNFEILRQYCDDDSSAGWILTRCRLVITLMHYVVTANYFWLLVEGLYLQMLLIFVMAENKYFAGFMVFGWGAPWISVLIWVVLRINFENKGCWETNDNLQVWWTIRAPIMISIFLNFIMFINIVRMIVSKLKANNMAKTDKKLRLAKSTLALIPLLGIHYMVFLAITEEVIDTSKPTMHLKLAFELFFNSIQGTLISVLYCFLNHEVRTEVRRAWKLWRSHQNLPRGGSTFRKSSTVGSANNSTQVTILYSRHSATASDMPLLDQSRTSSNSECDTKDNAANHAKANGDCIAINQRGGLKIHSKMNGLISGSITQSQPLNGHGHIGNGGIHFSSADPFLLQET